MNGHSNSAPNMAFLKSRYTKNKAAGEKLISAEYWMTIKGYEQLSTLIRATQFPELTREDVEDVGPSGVKFNQHGVLRNSGEFQVSCAETIEGDVFKALKQMVQQKEYVEIVIQAASESKGGESGGITRKYTDCKIYCDAIDMASDDVTTVVRPSLRIVYNWFE